VWRKVPEGKGATTLDWRGAVLMAGAMLGLVWGLVHGNPLGWRSNEVLASLGGGIILAAAFVASQRNRAWDAMIPPRLFRSPVFGAGLAVILLLNASLFGTLFFIAQYFQVVQDKSPLAAGLSMLPWTATLFVVAPIAGSMVARIGERTLVVAGLALQAAGMLWLAALAQSNASYPMWVLPLVLAGAGITMAMPAVQSAVLGAVEPPDIGKASGLFNTLRQLGGVLGVSLIVALFVQVGGYASAQAFGAGFAAALVGCAVLSVLGAVFGLRLRGRREREVAISNIQGAKS
jgi:predicted MFS family arabinose efflux permease